MAQHQVLRRQHGRIPPTYARWRMRPGTVLIACGVIALFFLSFLLLISSRSF